MSRFCYNGEATIGDSLRLPISVKIGHAVPYNIITAWENDWRKDNKRGLAFVSESQEVEDGDVIVTRHYVVTDAND